MTPTITGIHHVTALAKSPQQNLDFYTRTLGLRLVKKTVNFDDPLTYHLYYGDTHGSPGTILTHFPHPHAKAGVHGAPEIRTTTLAVPPGSLTVWAERLRDAGTAATTEDTPFGPRLVFADPDDMRFALTEHDLQPLAYDHTPGALPPEHAINIVDAMSIHLRDPEPTAAFLTGVLGFSHTATHASTSRFHLHRDAPGQRLDLIQDDDATLPRMGAGTVHHVAWRIPDESAQAAVAEALTNAGLSITPVMDRQYFRSIYCRIPGGVIFEFATDAPGFTADEPLDSLGTSLKLPPQHEPRRAEIEQHVVHIQ